MRRQSAVGKEESLAHIEAPLGELPYHRDMVTASCANGARDGGSAADLPTAIGEGLPGSIALSAHLIGQLGVDRRYQGRGYGEALLYDAQQRAGRMIGDSASLGVVVHALDARAAAWYQRVGFMPFPTHPSHLMLRMKDIRALMAAREP